MIKRPTALSVTPRNDYTLIVVFDNEEVKLFDVKPYIIGDWFGELNNPSLFKTVTLQD